LPHFVERRKEEKRVLLGGCEAAAQQNIIFFPLPITEKTYAVTE